MFSYTLVCTIILAWIFQLLTGTVFGWVCLARISLGFRLLGSVWLDWDIISNLTLITIQASVCSCLAGLSFNLGAGGQKWWWWMANSGRHQVDRLDRKVKETWKFPPPSTSWKDWIQKKRKKSEKDFLFDQLDRMGWSTKYWSQTFSDWAYPKLMHLRSFCNFPVAMTDQENPLSNKKGEMGNWFGKFLFALL